MSYQLEVSPAAQREIKQLPGHVRQRIRRAVANLRSNPRPADSEALEYALTTGEPRRIRLGRWRIIYAVLESDVRFVAVLAVRRRPPYDYEDLSNLFSAML